jgi:hypothetical protein
VPSLLAAYRNAAGVDSPRAQGEASPQITETPLRSRRRPGL